MTDEPTTDTVQTTRWVNAVIEVVVPLDDVAVDAPKWAKQEAAGLVAERIAELLPDDMSEFVLAGRWEDMSDASRGWRLWPIIRTVRFWASGWSRLTPDLGPEQFCGEHYCDWSYGRWFPRWCRTCRRVRKDPNHGGWQA